MSKQAARGDRRWLRGSAAVLLALVGAVSGLAALLLHGHWWGLALAWAAGAAAVWALPSRWWGRPAFVLGWVVVLAGGLFPRAEGDFLVAATWQGYLMLASGLVFVPFAVHGISQSTGPSRRRETARLDRAS